MHKSTKLLILFDFYMQYRFGIGVRPGSECPFNISQINCRGGCGFFFPECTRNTHSTRCPCHYYDDEDLAMRELHLLLEREGYIND